MAFKDCAAEELHHLSDPDCTCEPSDLTLLLAS